MNCQFLNPLHSPLSPLSSIAHGPVGTAVRPLLPSATCLRMHQALKAFLLWITGPRPGKEGVDFLMDQRKRCLDLLEDDVHSFSMDFYLFPLHFFFFFFTAFASLFPHTATVVTRNGLCFGKADVRPDEAQGQGST